MPLFSFAHKNGVPVDDGDAKRSMCARWTKLSHWKNCHHLAVISDLTNRLWRRKMLSCGEKQNSDISYNRKLKIKLSFLSFNSIFMVTICTKSCLRHKQAAKTRCNILTASDGNWTSHGQRTWPATAVFSLRGLLSIGNKNNRHTHRQKSLNTCNLPSPFRTHILPLPSYTKELPNYESSSWWKLHHYICQRATCVFKNITPETLILLFTQQFFRQWHYSRSSQGNMKNVFSSKRKSSWRLLESFSSYFESNRLVNAKRYFSIMFYNQLNTGCVFWILFMLEHDNIKIHIVYLVDLEK
jgi:hypothetical protein